MADTARAFSIKQERMVAKQLGGYPVGGSGAMPGVPGDVKTYEWLVECKTHVEPNHSIFFDINVWAKIKGEAMVMHRKPVLIVDDGSQSVDNTWCLCNESDIKCSRLITIDWPTLIRKNITGTNSSLKENLKKQTKRYIGDLYEAGVYEVNWGTNKVLIMPLKTFKEIFNK